MLNESLNPADFLAYFAEQGPRFKNVEGVEKILRQAYADRDKFGYDPIDRTRDVTNYGQVFSDLTGFNARGQSFAMLEQLYRAKVENKGRNVKFESYMQQALSEPAVPLTGPMPWI